MNSCFVVISPANQLRATTENPLKWVKTIVLTHLSGLDRLARSLLAGLRAVLAVVKRLLETWEKGQLPARLLELINDAP